MQHIRGRQFVPDMLYSYRESTKYNRIHQDHVEGLAVEWRNASSGSNPSLALGDIARKIEQTRHDEIAEREAVSA